VNFKSVSASVVCLFVCCSFWNVFFFFLFLSFPLRKCILNEFKFSLYYHIILYFSKKNLKHYVSRPPINEHKQINTKIAAPSDAGAIEVRHVNGATIEWCQFSDNVVGGVNGAGEIFVFLLQISFVFFQKTTRVIVCCVNHDNTQFKFMQILTIILYIVLLFDNTTAASIQANIFIDNRFGSDATSAPSVVVVRSSSVPVRFYYFYYYYYYCNYYYCCCYYYCCYYLKRFVVCLVCAVVLLTSFFFSIMFSVLLVINSKMRQTTV
jgi:hypothetical protein